MGLRGSLQGLQQHLGRQSIGQRQLATGKHQHVANLMLKLMQALFQASGETLLGLHRQGLFGEMAGVQQGRRQRGANLMREGSDHPPQGRQPLMTSQLILEATGFSQVIEQHQLPRFAFQRTRGNRQPSTVLEGDFMTVVFTRSKAAGDHLAPQLTFQRRTQQLTGGGVSLADKTMGVDHDHAARQQVEQVLQAIGQAFLFRQLGHALGTDHGQLALELGDPRLEHAVGIGELRRHLVEQVEGLLKTQPACLLYGRRLPRDFRDRRHLGGLGHRALSLD